MIKKPLVKTLSFLGYEISREPLAELIEQSLAAARDRTKQVVFACANPHSLNVAREDNCFREALLHSDILVADGVGLTALAKLLGKGSVPRVTGTDYFDGIMSALDQAHAQLGRKGRVFFFGSTPKVLELIASRLADSYPNVELAGTISPPFGNWSDELERGMVEQINAANADVLWVGMTAPKQEKWAEKNRAALNVPIIGSIGAVFDFFAGTYPRAPHWACVMGVEWLVRLWREPRRMWRRTIISMPLFALHAIKYSLLGPSITTDSAHR